MIKESQIKFLYEIGLIEYPGLTEGSVWVEILETLEIAKFELGSNEKS